MVFQSGYSTIYRAVIAAPVSFWKMLFALPRRVTGVVLGNPGKLNTWVPVVEVVVDTKIEGSVSIVSAIETPVKTNVENSSKRADFFIVISPVIGVRDRRGTNVGARSLALPSGAVASDCSDG